MARCLAVLPLPTWILQALQALHAKNCARRPSACGLLSGSAWASCPARTQHVGLRRVTPGHRSGQTRRSAGAQAGTLARPSPMMRSTSFHSK
eukprot:scaffold36101_cov69-Phaeocystis_antarctica.AAC.2